MQLYDCSSRLVFFFFFFFQAEDGIRDLIVTGVQTCALPICPAGGAKGIGELPMDGPAPAIAAAVAHATGVMVSELPLSPESILRSEERRVGKECRARWAP